MKTIIIGAVLLAASMANAATCEFEWDASPEADVATYRLYKKGTAAPVVSVPKTQTRATASVCEHGDTFYATAVDTSGNESQPSNEVTVDRVAPSALRNFRLRLTIE